MHLKVNQYPVQSLSQGKSTHYSSGELIVNREELIDYLQASGELEELEVTDIALISPGTKTRVINIFDVFPAHARLGEHAVDYPGIFSPMQSVGDGETAALDNFSVLTISSKTDKYNKLLDMSGLGSEITPYSKQFHLAISVETKQPGMTKTAYYYALKRIGLRVGNFLAKSAAAVSPVKTSSYTLDPRPQGLPRAAYVFMVASHQKSESGEPILYGDDVSGLHPTVLHPNEVLDGALVSPYWNLGIDTYSFQNNPVVMGLYDRHAKDIDFAGVVVNVSHITRQQRERSVQMVSNLVAAVLGADLAVVTKVGGGIPESDLMLTVEDLEKRGVRTAIVTMSHMGDGTLRDSLSAYSSAADAIASAGVQDEWLDLSEQANVIGGSMVGPFTDDPNDKPQPANAAIRVRYRDISGAISQLGASFVSQMEI